MSEDDWLSNEFEVHRRRLHALAYRMLGSAAEAEDVVQETWVRAERADRTDIANRAGWLTTIAARLCLNVIRTRSARREEPLDTFVPDPVIEPDITGDPEQQVVLADSVGLAMLTVIQTLEPAERLAFILHDTFAMPFEQIAPIVGRSVEATRQLASRARRRVRSNSPDVDVDVDIGHQREVVAAFFAAARGGDINALIAILDPAVVLRSDGGTARPIASAVVRGAAAVASRAIMFSQPDADLRPALVNGAAGVVVIVDGTPNAVMAFTVRGNGIIAIDVLADPERVRTLAGVDDVR